MPAAPTIDKQEAGNALDFVDSKLTEFGKNLSGTLDAHRKAIKNDWEVEKKNLDSIIQQQGSTIEVLQKAHSDLKRALTDDELDGRRSNAERRAASERAAERRRPIGQQVLRSFEFATWHSQGGTRGNGSVVPCAVPVKNFWGQTIRKSDARAFCKDLLDAVEAAAKSNDPKKMDMRSIEFDETNAGEAVIPMYHQGVIENPMVIPLIRRIASVMPTDETNVIKGDREVRRLDLVAVVSESTNAPATVFPVNQTTGFSAAAGFNKVYLDNGTTIEERTLDSVASGSLTLTAASSINMAAGTKIYALHSINTPEGEPAPLVMEQLEKYDVYIYDFSDSIKIALNKLDDIPWSEKYISDRLLKKLAIKVDYNSWYGPGGSGKVLGFFNDPSIETSTRLANESYIDFMIRANYEVYGRYFMPSVAPVSLDVHRDICRVKGTDGHYIAWQNVQAGSPPQIHVTRLEMAPQMAPASGGTGDFGLGATVYDREEASVEIGTNNDDFARRKRSIQALERVGIGFEQPMAMQKLVFTPA